MTSFWVAIFVAAEKTVSVFFNDKTLVKLLAGRKSVKDQFFGSVFEIFSGNVLKVFILMTFIAYLASALAGQFFAPAHVKSKLGFFSATKEYVDEVADLASIFLYALTLGVVHAWKRTGSNIQNFKEGKTPTDVNNTFFAAFKGPIFTFVVILTISFFVSLQLVAEQTSVNFFKNNLDEVADVCSILTVATLFYYEHRVRHVVAVLNVVFSRDMLMARREW